MPNSILAPPNEEAQHYAAILADFQQRMSIAEAAKYIGVSAKQIRAAIECGELEYVRCYSQKRVTPLALAKYIEQHLTVPTHPLPQ